LFTLAVAFAVALIEAMVLLEVVDRVFLQPRARDRRGAASSRKKVPPPATVARQRPGEPLAQESEAVRMQGELIAELQKRMATLEEENTDLLAEISRLRMKSEYANVGEERSTYMEF